MKEDPDYDFHPFLPPKTMELMAKYWKESIRQHGQKVFLDAVDSHESELKDDPWDNGWGYVDEDPSQDD